MYYLLSIHLTIYYNAIYRYIYIILIYYKRPKYPSILLYSYTIILYCIVLSYY